MHAKRPGLRRQRSAAGHVIHVQRASAQANEKSDDDGCQVVLTDADESDDADAALVVPGKETDVAVLGTAEWEVALPKAFCKVDLIATQAKDPDCSRYMQLVNNPRMQWSPHLAAAPLQLLDVTGALCVQTDDVVHPQPCQDDETTGRRPRRRRIRRFLGRPRIVLPADFRQPTIHVHRLSYYGGHFGLAQIFARLCCGIGGHGSPLTSARS